MTDPEAVPSFLDASVADLLAVAVGNVHGHYTSEPKLEWGIIEDIRAAAPGVPLVLHGASGIPSSDLSRAPAAGIGKINMNTELRSEIFRSLDRTLDSHRGQGLNLLGLLTDWTDAAGGFALAAHRTLSHHR